MTSTLTEPVVSTQAPSKCAKLLPHHQKVLAWLVEEYSEDFGYHCFESIMSGTQLDRRTVRLACRALARKRLTDFKRGLWTDCGEPRGAGYSATDAGVAAIAKATGGA